MAHEAIEKVLTALAGIPNDGWERFGVPTRCIFKCEAKLADEDVPHGIWYHSTDCPIEVARALTSDMKLLRATLARTAEPTHAVLGIDSLGRMDLGVAKKPDWGWMDEEKEDLNEPEAPESSRWSIFSDVELLMIWRGLRVLVGRTSGMAQKMMEELNEYMSERRGL
jgi:hypothetical protein